ncbi:MAG: hypothetical protein ABIA93_01325, partial [Candidatus Woesearchaeota archaeon]
MGKAKKLFTNIRILIAVALLIIAVIAINPNPWVEGVAIRTVEKSSSASLAGIPAPTPATLPRMRERILSINNEPVTDVKSYYDLISSFGPNRTFSLVTNKNVYRLTTQPLINVTVLGETYVENITRSVFNETLNETVNVTEQVVKNKTIETVIGVKPVGLTVYDAPTTNIRLGLDLTGGTRVVLEPAEEATPEDMALVIENIKERLNAFGLSDLTVRQANDLGGDQFIIVEIAGANKEEVRDLLAKQGKFEAKIGNSTVFRGGQDITYVCFAAECSGIDPQVG